MIVTPDDNSITVFNKGSSNGSNGIIPETGQAQPTVAAGDKLQWKKAQKNEKKNIISEIINKHMPKRTPFCTLNV